MVTSVTLALVISFEPHELDVMQRPPRAIETPIVDRFGIWRIVFVCATLLALTLLLFARARSSDASDELARAIAVNALVIGQVFYLLNSRYKFNSSLSFKAHLNNRYLGLGIGAVVVAQGLFTYAPPSTPSSIPRSFRSMNGPGSSWAVSCSSSSWRRRSWSFGWRGRDPVRIEAPDPPVG